MSQRVTLRDVAQYVGVSITTISNVVRGWPYAADETRLKAQQSILKLRYSPDETKKAASIHRANNRMVDGIQNAQAAQGSHTSDRFQMPTVPIVTMARAGIDLLLSLSRDETSEQSHIILEPNL